jgi:hypothetical protein
MTGQRATLGSGIQPVRASPSLVVHEQSKCGERLIFWRGDSRGRRLRSALPLFGYASSPSVLAGVVCIGHGNRPQHYVRFLLHSFRFSISKRDERIALWKSIHSEHVFEVDVDSTGQRAGPCAPRPCCHVTPSMLTSARDSTIARFRGLASRLIPRPRCSRWHGRLTLDPALVQSR